MMTPGWGGSGWAQDMSPCPGGAELVPTPPAAIRIKKPIKTKFRLPVFNWTALKPSQISGTVFSELDDERVLEVSPGAPPH